jgi:hypothetical protein
MLLLLRAGGDEEDAGVDKAVNGCVRPVHGPRFPRLDGAVKFSTSRGEASSKSGDCGHRFYCCSVTSPVDPFIVTTSPVFTSDVSPRMPTIVGMPISRATMAEWERMEPRSINRPEMEG